MNDRKKNIVIASLAISLTASSALVAVLANISAEYPKWDNWVQLLITLPPLVTIISSLFVPSLLNFFNDRQIALGGFFLVIFSGLYPFFYDSFLLLLLSRITMGLGLGLVSTISYSLPASYFPMGKKRDTATGIQAAFSNVSSIIFSFLSGLLAIYYWKNVYLIQLLNLMPFLIVFFLMEASELIPSSQRIEKGKEKFIVKDGLFITVFAFLCISLVTTYSLNISIFIKDKNLGNSAFAGSIVSINSFIGFLIGIYFYKIIKVLNENILAISLFAIGLSFLFISLSSNIVIFIISSLVFGIGKGIMYPSFVTMLFREISEDKLIPAMSMYTIASNISQFLSPFMVNPLSNLFGNDIKYRFIVSAFGIILLSIYIFIYLARKYSTNI